MMSKKKLFTKRDVERMSELRKNGFSYHAIGLRYGVVGSCIYRYLNVYFKDEPR